MNILYFFDIYVYRISSKEYCQQMDEARITFLDGKEEFFKQYPNFRHLNIKTFNKIFGGIWEYNEIIGFIKLHILGTQVRGEYFSVDSKRIVKTRKKQFKHSVHKLAPERELPLTGDNQEIYNVILSYLEDCKKELPKRFIDTSLFEMVGPYIDWKELAQCNAES